jgi:hypothetical protein
LKENTSEYFRKTDTLATPEKIRHSLTAVRYIVIPLARSEGWRKNLKKVSARENLPVVFLHSPG